MGAEEPLIARPRGIGDTNPSAAMETHPMQRRQFLSMTVLAGLACAQAAAARPSTALATPGLLALLGDRDAVEALGCRYRQLVPAEDDPQVLARAVAPSRATGRDLDAWIAHRIAQDFAAGHTVTINGWILSVTEARQCALFSLLAA